MGIKNPDASVPQSFLHTASILDYHFKIFFFFLSYCVLPVKTQLYSKVTNSYFFSFRIGKHDIGTRLCFQAIPPPAL